MKNSLFTGLCTALVTPFLGDRINYPMMERLLARQIEAGITTVVLAGTTGEAPTLTDGEKLELFHRAKEFTGDACRIIAGTGSNDTSHAVRLSMAAEDSGADALLIVSPYYNKSNTEGLIAHFTTIAQHVSLPIIVYNVPSRSGLDIPVPVYKALSNLPNIAGVKEASASVTKITQIRNACPHDFSIWSGNDDLAVQVISLGGQGLISVVSNIKPMETAAMVNAALDGDFDTASALQVKLQPLCELLFSEVNPIPVKAAMKYIGYDCGNCRLPLGKLSDANREKMKHFFA